MSSERMDLYGKYAELSPDSCDGCLVPEIPLEGCLISDWLRYWNLWGRFDFFIKTVSSQPMNVVIYLLKW